MGKQIKKVEPEAIDKKTKTKDDKYIKIPSDAKADVFKAIGDRVQKGEVKWDYFTIEGDKSYHYYLILKTL